MGLVFNPTTGKFDVDNKQSLTTLDSRYVNVTGDTMTGGLLIEPTTDTLTALVVNDTDSNNVLTVDTINNRVGIGTTSPGFKLQIAQDQTYAPTDSGQIVISGTTTQNKRLMLGFDTTNNYGYIESAWRGQTYEPLALQPSSGNVGIGTTAPESLLDLTQNSDPNLILRHLNETLNDQATINFLANTGAVSAINATAQIKAIVEQATPSTLKGSLLFRTNRGDTVQDAMAIDETGNVGIGTIGPTAKLDINSNILRLRTAKTPASAGAAGNVGDICWDANFIYVAVATNTWKKASIATW